MFLQFKSVRAAILTTAILVTGVAAQAATVEYYTTGTFSNAATPLTYTPIGSAATPAYADLSLGSTFASLGEIVNHAGSSMTTLSGNLTINVFQVSPTNGTGSLAGTLSGKIKSTSSTALFTPAVASLTIGDFTYSFTQSSYALVPITTNRGVTSLQGQIDSSAVPEPTSMALLGGGITLLGLVGRRRQNAA